MSNFSKTMLPPILNHSYDGFRYESKSKGAVDVLLPARLSAGNTLDQVDHIQVRIVSMNSNINGLNRTLYPNGTMYIPMNSDRKVVDFDINFKTVVNGTNIFNVGNSVFPSFYKIQIRAQEKNTETDYKTSYGQNPPSEWINNSTPFLSEWSNVGIIKTVSEPDVGIFNLTEGVKTTLLMPDYTFQGWYRTNDDNEPMSSYQMLLYKGSRLIEEGKTIFIKEYENPSISYKFKEIFVRDEDYTLELIITTRSGYKDITRYLINFDLSFTKLYNIFSVDEDDVGAFNTVNMSAKQIQLIATKPYEDTNWLVDQEFDKLGETGVTHFHLVNGSVTTPPEFNIPYDIFSIALSVTDIKNKAQTRLRDCFVNKNEILSFHTGVTLGTSYKVGLLVKPWGYYLVLEEKFTGLNGNFTNYYDVRFSDRTLENNKEHLILIKKSGAGGDTVFEVLQWLDNRFEEKEH